MTEVLAAGGVIPDTVREAVLARVAGLTEQARHLLNAVAVVPAETELWLLEAMLGATSPASTSAPRPESSSHAPGRVAFRHELAREAVERRCRPTSACSSTARRCAPSPSRRSGSPTSRVSHTTPRPPATSPPRSEFAREAGVEATAYGAHAEAAAHFRRAARPRRACRSRTAPTSWSGSRTRASSSTTSRSPGIQACGYSRAGARSATRSGGRALREVSRVLRLLGRSGEAEQAAQAGVVLLEDGLPGRELAHVYDHVAWLRLLDNENDEAIEWALRAIAVAEEVGDRAVVAHARLTIGSAEYSLGRAAWRRRSRTRSPWRRRSRPPRPRPGTSSSRGRWTSCRTPSCTSATSTPPRTSSSSASLHTGTHDLWRWRANLLMEQATLALVRGAWSDAIAGAEAALEANVFPHTRRLALVAAARARARSGEPGAWDALDEAFRCGHDAEDLDQLGPLAVARAEAHWLAARADEVADDTDRALAAATERADAWWLGELAWLRRLAGIEEPPPEAAAEPFGSRSRAGGASRRSGGGRSGRRTRPRWRSSSATRPRRCARRSSSCAGSGPTARPRSSRPACVRSASGRSRGGRARPRAGTRPA